MDSSYDNLGGMNMQNETGDIILAPSASSGKVKKKWVIAVVLVVSLAAVGLIAWLLIDNVFFAATPDSVRQDFNKFANYVMSGEELTSEINPKLDLRYNYYFTDDDLSIEQKQSIYKKTKNLFDNFLNQYNKLEDKAAVVSDLERFDNWSKSTEQSLTQLLSDNAENGGSSVVFVLKVFVLNALINDGDIADYVTT